MATCRVTISWLRKNLLLVIEHHRLNMDYTYTVEKKKLGWFKTERIKTPMENEKYYWSVMQTFYPWNQLAGLDALISDGSSTAILTVDAELVSRMFEVLDKKSTQ